MGELEIFLGQIYGTDDQSWKWKARNGRRFMLKICQQQRGFNV
jgi:hypothetical protein